MTRLHAPLIALVFSGIACIAWPAAAHRDQSHGARFTPSTPRRSSWWVDRADSAGRVVFKLARAGKWLLRGTELRSSTRPATDWESDFTTLSFEVR